MRTLRRSEFARLAGASLLAGSLASCNDSERLPDPGNAPTFAQARDLIYDRLASDSADSSLNTLCLPRLYHHGKRTARSVLLFHGFTNCPQQFDALAKALYARGCNVYVPRIPGHGKADRLTQALDAMSVAGLQTFADRAATLTQALGEKTTVLGLSLGGVLALWLAQTRALDTAISVAPFLVPVNWTRAQGRTRMRIAQALPDFYWWWNLWVLTGTKPDYAYPGYPIHALAQITFLGEELFDRAAVEQPRTRRGIFVLNVDDNGINNDVARDLLRMWQQRGAPYIEETLRNLGPPRHDIIDLSTFPAAQKLVYPLLESLAIA